MKKLIFGLIATVVFGSLSYGQNLRANFLKGKTNDEFIKSFNELTTEQKSALWVEKMDQLLTQKFTDEDLQLIKKMKDAHLEKDLEAFKNATLSLASNIPDDDFIEMFVKLSDYNFTGKFVGKLSVSDSHINEIKSTGESYETIDVVTKKPKCNCNWTCSWYGNYSTNCIETETGCGFFGHSFCNGHV